MSIRKPLPQTSLEDYINGLIPLQSGFDLIRDHVVITDSNANILYANKAVEDQTGFSINEIAGKNPGDLWGGNMPKEFYEKMWHTIKIEKKPFVGEMKNKRKNGAEIWQELHISPILDAIGEVKYFLAIEPNISDRKKREQFKEEFISMFGHQLKSPLIANRWMLEWLIGHNELSGEQSQTIENIYKNNLNLNNLINDMLTIFQFQKESLKVDFDLAQEIGGIIDKEKSRNPGISYSFLKEDESYSFCCNKNLTVKVLQAIIANASDYSPKEGGKVEIAIRKDAGKYVFSCKDNGIGIPLDEQKDIFTRFFRGSNAREINKNGAGLGLFISKMIADNFGWEISFESSENSGTIFFVDIPITQ